MSTGEVLVTCAGIYVVDIIAADLLKISDPGELTFAPKGIELCIGGHAANVSIDLMQLGFRKGEVSSVGPIGDDLFGDFIGGELEKRGVVKHVERKRGVETSKDIIMVVKGQDRRYHVDVGANLWLSSDYVQTILRSEKPLIFYVGGTGLLGKFDEQLADNLQEAKRLGCLTFVDPVTPFGHEWEIILPALNSTDIFHCNNFEASKITGEDETEEAMKALIKKGAKFVIVSMGAEGLIAGTKEITLKMPALNVSVVDPSGAGDAFCAGLIYGFIKTTHGERHETLRLPSKGLTSILLEGEAAGAACVTAVGTTTAVTRENVNRLLREQGSAILERVQCVGSR